MCGPDVIMGVTVSPCLWMPFILIGVFAIGVFSAAALERKDQ